MQHKIKFDMKINYNFNFCLLSYKELCNLNLHKINRCGEIVEQIALKNYSQAQYDSFIKRCETTLKEIKKKGYNPTSMLILAKCKEDGLLYLIEGQGRRGAIILGTERGIINIDEIPCVIFAKELSYSEIGEEIIKHNIQKSNVMWKSDDIAASQARQIGGDVEKAYMFQHEYQERLQLSSKPYMARLMIFGANKASHIRDYSHPFTFEDFRKDHELFMSLYEYFVKNFGRDEWKKKYRQKIRNQTLGIVYDSFFTKLYNFTVEAGLDPYKYLTRVNEELCKWANKKATIDRFVSFLSIKIVDKREFMDFPGLDGIIMSVYPDNVRFDFTAWRYGNLKNVA